MTSFGAAWSMSESDEAMGVDTNDTSLASFKAKTRSRRRLISGWTLDRSCRRSLTNPGSNLICRFHQKATRREVWPRAPILQRSIFPQRNTLGMKRWHRLFCTAAAYTEQTPCVFASLQIRPTFHDELVLVR